MRSDRRSFLREVMETAWGLYKAELRGPNPRTFADALAGAWRWMKASAARIKAQPRWVNGDHSRSLSFGTMLQSPIRRSLSGQRYAETRARAAGRVTTAVGC